MLKIIFYQDGAKYRKVFYCISEYFFGNAQTIRIFVSALVADVLLDVLLIL